MLSGPPGELIPSMGRRSPPGCSCPETPPQSRPWRRRSWASDGAGAGHLAVVLATISPACRSSQTSSWSEPATPPGSRRRGRRSAGHKRGLVCSSRRVWPLISKMLIRLLQRRCGARPGGKIIELSYLAVWTATLVVITLVGGWLALGTVLGFSQFLQVPGDLHRIGLPVPLIAPATWWIAGGERGYGWFHGDAPIMILRRHLRDHVGVDADPLLHGGPPAVAALPLSGAQPPETTSSASGSSRSISRLSR